MDEPNRWNKFRQQDVTLHLSDGSDFKIATWKITQSRALHKDYIRREKKCNPVKNMSLLYSRVNEQEMRLYSEICDQEPGKAFNDYFVKLNPQEQKITIDVTGKCAGNKKEKKLNCPGLVAQLLPAYFLKTGYSEESTQIFLSNHIKPLMKCDRWLDLCATEMARSNLPLCIPDMVFDQYFEIVYADDGKIQKIPACLIGNSYNVESCFRKNIYDDKEFILYGVKKFKDAYEYHITSSVPYEHKEKKDNQILVRLINPSGQAQSSTMIQHEDKISDQMFDKTGNYLSIVSKKMIEIVQLKRSEDNISVVDGLKIPIADKVAVLTSCFDKQSKVFLMSLYDFSNEDDEDGELILINLSDQFRRFCLDKKCGIVSNLLFNGDGNRLLTHSLRRDASIITVWDMSTMPNVHRIKDFDVMNHGTVKASACTANGKKCAIVFDTGAVMFIDEKKNNKLVTMDCMLPDCAIALYDTSDVRVQYSNDNRFVAILYPRSKGKQLITLYSVITYQPLRSISVDLYGMGFTADDSKLMLLYDNPSNPACAKIQLFTPENHRDLDYLRSKTSLHQLASMLCLWRAYRSGNMTILYEEEQMYKALGLLQHNLFDFIKRCFPEIKIIDNNKELKKTFQDIINVAAAEYDVVKDKFEQWWKKR